MSGWQNEPWMDLLRAEKAKGRSTAAIARDLGYARTSIALVFSGNYPIEPRRVAAKVLEVYGADVNCPHLGREIPRGDCNAIQAAPMPTSSPDKLRHWTACRACHLNPAAAAASKKRKT